MIHLKGGPFHMGTTGIGYGIEPEQPAHWVKVPSFWIDVTEVTVAAYRACVHAGRCTPTPKTERVVAEDDKPIPCNLALGLDDDPINCVTWSQADAYCRFAGKELPTEELWEYAARGKEGRDFPWGWAVRGMRWGMPASRPHQVSCNDEAHKDVETCPVGQTPKADTKEGVKELASNVTEWTSSFFCPYKQPDCNTKMRALRGGSKYENDFWARAAARHEGDPDMYSPRIGFRCVKRDP